MYSCIYATEFAPMTDALTLARLSACAGLFFLALFAVFKVPLGVLWKPAVGATEYGHLLALVSIVLLLPGWGDARQSAAFALAAIAALLFSTPTLRALWTAGVVASDGAALWGDLTPPEAQPTPFSVLRMLSAGPEKVEVNRHTYDETHQLELEIYGSATGPARPLVVVIHGGSWNSGDYTQLPAINHYLASRGYTVAAITYRLAPEHTFPAQRDDVLTAIRWLKNNASRFAIDPTRIALMGRSAGGQLALSTAYGARDPSIKGVVSYYAPVDLTYAWTHPTNPWVIDTHTSLSDYLGGPLEERLARYREASPIDAVGEATPPTLLVHGGRDELVFPIQTERLRARLAAEETPHLVIDLPWGTHGLEANIRGPSGQISTWAIERFLALVFS
jgi:acetyl esterase/lipase